MGEREKDLLALETTQFLTYMGSICNPGSLLQDL